MRHPLTTDTQTVDQCILISRTCYKTCGTSDSKVFSLPPVEGCLDELLSRFCFCCYCCCHFVVVVVIVVVIVVVVIVIVVVVAAPIAPSPSKQGYRSLEQAKKT